MPADFLRGFHSGLSGLQWLFHRRLRVFVLVPLAINILVFGAAFAWATEGFGDLLDRLLGQLPDWLSFLRWLLWPIFVLGLIVVVFYTFTIVANLLGAPFNGFLSARVEQLLGADNSESSAFSWRDIVGPLFDELRKLVYFLVRAVPLMLLVFVPVVNFAWPALWLAFTCWMLALEYLDYPLGNRGLSFRSQRDILRQRPMIALGFGAAVMLMTVIPVLNFLAMPAAVIAATRLTVEEL